ncbi:helix-turn-helix transcriptional regulator [Snodgrassella sp. CFCC 13594]|uniref:S24 family peptidase n=1 Tax=Snodgrassella sp. CFCC 13594 TaxID=1775559 RepID=UPI00083584D0|nr:helix-turn-helix transcriptional regulator [Snodgrassella sp. CFCC 13594]
MSTFKDRLASLWPGERQAKIAADIDMTMAGFSRIWHEGGLPKADTLKKIKLLKGCSLDWLLTGEGDPFPEGAQQQTAVADTLGNPVDADDFVYVPRYDIEAAAGHGRLAEHERPLFTMAFRRDWIHQMVSNRPSGLSVISVKGDSMEGVLNDGDTILISEVDGVSRDGLYVLRINDNLLVKRLQLMPGNMINVISANEAYPSFEINLNQTEDHVQIIGKVVWFGRYL